MADPISRARWLEFYRRCAQLGVRPKRLKVCPAACELYAKCVARQQRVGDGTAGFSFGAFCYGATKICRKDADELPSNRVHLLLEPQAIENASTPNSALPPAPSALCAASAEMARRRIISFCEGGGEMAFSASQQAMLRMAEAIDEGAMYGINANTAQTDDRAWAMWATVTVCGAHGTSPYRSAREAQMYPERNAHLLAALMMHAFAVCRPKTPGARFIKPRSDMAYPLAIMRVFGRWGVLMPPYKLLRSAMAHLSRHIAHHGPHSLAPRRAEPMKFTMSSMRRAM
ncbi:MAG: hypothetical protein SGPRY_008512 [Prymnesium sp.]